MFMLQHHLQQWDRYHEGMLNQRIKSVMPFYWGLVDIEINREALENGTVMLLSCRGILPGGQFIDIPDMDEAPPSRSADEQFDASLESLDVYLATPVDRVGSINCKLDDESTSIETRYSRDFVRVVDENTGENEQEIPVARKNLKLIFGNESLDGYEYLKIAELRRTASGAIALRDEYIPPSIAISGSLRLMRMVRRLIEILTARSDELRERCQERTNGLYEFGAADVSYLWLLQTINSFVPELNHFHNTGLGHPEELFRVLSRFAGSLTAFSARIRPVNLPKYDHSNLSSCFGELDALIRELLDTIVQDLLQILVPITKYSLIPLRETRESTYYYDIAEHLFDPAYKYYVAFKAEGDQTELVNEVPRRVKVASAKEIDFLVGKALRGVRLNYVPSPPTDIPRKPGFAYFVMDTETDFWDDVQESRSLAIYAPVSFVGLELELIALEESDK